MSANLRTDFDAFLFAPIGEDTNGLPLTLLSVFARLGIDPWEEAAELADLPLEPALQRLAARLEAAPDSRPASAADTVNIATRLVALLHRAPALKASAPEALPRLKMSTQSKGVKLAVYCLIGMLLMLVTQWALANQLEPAPLETSIVADLRG